MGKNRHSKDRIFITATEWATEYGGKKDKKSTVYRPLPFDYCGLSLCQYEVPVCLKEGVIFDLEALMEYILKHKKNPITGESVSPKDIIRLNMAKSDDGYWQCPVTNKAFTNYSHVVAIRTTGNVYTFEAVNELNIKAKNLTDLISGEPFTREDIITLQNPNDEAHMALRDISNFAHIKELREENVESQKSESKIRFNPTAEKVIKEIESNKVENEKKKKLSDYVNDIYSDKSYKDDVKEFLDMKPTIEDINPGQTNTDGKASSSLTSSVMSSHTSNSTRLATAEEIRDGLCKKIRSLGKKGYVQLQTSLGNLNMEINCDIAPRTSWNFIQLCKQGYYNDTIFHRLVQNFMVQGGDPTGTGSGGESLWQSPFRDEFDTRTFHDKRGVLSMANSGSNTNGSQFFIVFKQTKHLDLKHTVFGRIVGGNAVLDRIEAIGNDDKEKPLQEIKLVRADVFTNPIEEAMVVYKNYIKENMEKRLNNSVSSALPRATHSNPMISDSNTHTSIGMKRSLNESNTYGIGKYIPNKISKSTDSKSQDDKVAAFLKSQSHI